LSSTYLLTYLPWLVIDNVTSTRSLKTLEEKYVCFKFPTAAVLGVTAVNGSLSGQLEFVSKVFTAAEQFERSPRLKAEWNERVRRDQALVVSIDYQSQ